MSAQGNSSGQKRDSQEALFETGGPKESKRVKNNEIPSTGLYPATAKGQTLSRESHLIQCAGYAMEMLSNGGLRTHVLGSLVTDDVVEYLYYDRSVHVRSGPVNIRDDPIMFIAALDTLVKLDYSGWGYDPFISNPPYLTTTKLPQLLPDGTYMEFEGSELKLDNGYTLVLGEAIFHQHALIGRGTCVVKATLKSVPQVAKAGAADDLDQWNKPLIVKFSYGVASRKEREFDIIERLCELADKEGGKMLKHLPHALHGEKRELSGIPERVADLLNAGGEDSYERRTLHITVQEELFKVQDLVAKGMVKEFGEAVYDIYNCTYNSS